MSACFTVKCGNRENYFVSMSGIQRIFGSATTLLRCDGTSVPISYLSELKYVLLYFSAHWCPPCQRFTPKLVTMYKALRVHRQDVEIVFLSSDKSEAEFHDYFSTMPWLALPYDQRSVKTRLSGKFKVEEIPTLICLDHEGAVVCKDAMEPINTHHASASSVEEAVSTFPWMLPTITEAFEGAAITTKDGRALTVADLRGLDHFAVYFSASWCNPCKAFTPILTQIYENVKAAHPNTEVIFVSHDETIEDCDDYYAGMPWAALEYNSPNMGPIRAACEVSGIPTLTIVDGKSMTILNLDAVMVAARDSDGDQYPWVPQPRPLLMDLSFDQDKASAINEDVCFLLHLPKIDDGEEDDGTKVEDDGQSLLDEFKLIVGAFNAAALEVETFRKSQPSADDLKTTFFRVASSSGRELFKRVVGVTKISIKELESAPFILATRMGPHKIAEVLSGVILSDVDSIVAFGKAVYAQAATDEMK
jgi:nucleoredoxin